MIVLTQLARELNLMFILLVPPSISAILVITVSILILIPTLSIIFTLFSIPSGLLVTLLVRRLHKKYTRHLGRLR